MFILFLGLCNGTDIEFPSQLSDEMSAELIAGNVINNHSV